MAEAHYKGALLRQNNIKLGFILTFRSVSLILMVSLPIRNVVLIFGKGCRNLSVLTIIDITPNLNCLR